MKEQFVDLVVPDMIMPKGINGRETYERIIEIHPGQKAIIDSGFSEAADDTVHVIATKHKTVKFHTF